MLAKHCQNFKSITIECLKVPKLKIICQKIQKVKNCCHQLEFFQTIAKVAKTQRSYDQMIRLPDAGQKWMQLDAWDAGGHMWMQVDKSGCRWMKVDADRRMWIQVDADGRR